MMIKVIKRNKQNKRKILYLQHDLPVFLDALVGGRLFAKKK